MKVWGIRESAAKEKFEAIKKLIVKIDTERAIDKLYAEGNFITTANGPHYCKIGQTYRLWLAGTPWLCRASEVSAGLGGRAMMIFVPVGEQAPPGLADLDLIEDVA
jgi:predicted proteasome-type protease